MSRLTKHLVLLLAFSSPIKGAVIAGDAVLVPGGFMRDYELLLTKSIPVGEGLFAIGITQINPVQFQFDYLGIAEEYALYLASPGLNLLPSYASATVPFVTNTGAVGPGLLTLGVGQSVLLGYWDDRTPGDGIPDFGDNYGWVELARTPTELIATGGYTAIGSGIVVGTPNAIPEPSSAYLALISLSALGLRRRRIQIGQQGGAQEAPNC